MKSRFKSPSPITSSPPAPPFEVFVRNPAAAALSGLWPRLIGVLFKRIPKFGILLGYATITGDSGA